MIIKVPHKLFLLTVLATLIFCNTSAQLSVLRVENFESYSRHDFDLNFKAYCSRDTNKFENNAVLASFVGDYYHAYYYASRQRIPATQIEGLTINHLEIFKARLSKDCENPGNSLEERKLACKMLDVLSRPKEVDKLFNNYNARHAKDYITEQADKFNAVLINEAHYSGQHRAFTSSLLETLWQKGFRYLAIETLGIHDSLTQLRRYPSLSTGYYSKELAYAEFIRNALSIGYKLVSYEAEVSDENMRDSLQALNIYEKTFKENTGAKVIVHAGYAHIAEISDRNFTCMGFRLKQLLKKDIFTIDQTSMIGHSEISKRHPYYQHVASKENLLEPVVFLDSKGESLVDPVHAFGIDCQVYHPEVTYSSGHPNFLFHPNKKLYALPQKFKAYNGHLLQINMVAEDETAIPIERVILTGEETRALLKPGEYVGYLINQQGAAILKFKISAN